MSDHDDELSDQDQRALGAWTTLSPPADFADRVLAARERAPVVRRRWPMVAASLAACAAAAAAAFLLLRAPDRADHGELVADVRTTRALGDRAVAVAEPTATLTWRIDDDGDAVIEQRSGAVFYRVDRGGPFVVHTPAGDIHVTGTCFRIEVEPMNKPTQAVLSGTIGAVIAATVVVTVYEGHVIADARGTRTDLTAGQQATLGATGTHVAPASAAAGPDGWAGEDQRATREQLLARTVAQRTEAIRLRARIAELEQLTGGTVAAMSAEPGRAWHDPSPERLQAWVAECHVRADQPGLEDWQPMKSLGKNDRGLEPGELSAFNAALGEVQQTWKKLVRALYLEATNDIAGADILSTDAMRNEIQQKGAPGEHNLVLQKLAAERAGLAQPPADLARTSPYERLMRAYVQLGDDSEAALAKRLGPERAAAIRGDAWNQRSDWSGCPDPAR